MANDPSFAVSELAVDAPIPPVGSRSPRGDGRWGHADLTGSVYELVRDTIAGATDPYEINPCNDCAVFANRTDVVKRGGNFAASGLYLRIGQRSLWAATQRHRGTGVRCARDP